MTSSSPPSPRVGDLLSGPVPASSYTLGPGAAAVLATLGVPADLIRDEKQPRRPLLRFCLDWSEQQHHLGGRLGADLLIRFVDVGWITRTTRHRAVQLTPAGQGALRSRLGLDL